ncbi:Carotenoid 9,10(9',10')-cleavage dioxygenase [Dichanthelium oligosanthes]|uniref:Carotenoid 9,10(9',10')-cleavage dioxygenase n=1 Tax=Dichanthelium oligosanthes TaxID=888268 RepID=A0A1E5V2Y9_9POAL|nr:Carotenoid 9,10(9',10')-cleavage dioxygenase [Dichanthelium oligosanthes]
MMMKTPASFHPCLSMSSRAHGRRSSMSAGARTSSATSISSSSKKPLLEVLLGHLSSKMDKASKALNDVPQRFLDVLVDSTFKFTDQALNPSESNFAPVDEIGEAIEIHQIEGTIPEDFPEGVYIRNGSNPLFGALHSTDSIFGQSREIWVEGEGMLHALYFTKSSSGSWSVSYANRYVQSETLKLERARQKPCFLPAIEGDSAAIIAAYIFNYLRFDKVNKDISNTNVFEHAGRVFAVAENHLPQEICIDNLDTGHTWDIGGEWDRPFTAHPKVAPGSGELVTFGTDAKRPFLVIGVVSGILFLLVCNFIPYSVLYAKVDIKIRPQFNFYLTAADGTKLKHRVDLKLDRCTLCHDIGVTLKYNIIMDIPLTIDISRLIKGGQLIQFEKESYGRIGVMPRYGDADSVIWFNVEPFCMFHLVNCFEEGDEVVVQGLRSPDSIIPGPRLALNKYDSKMSQPTEDDKSIKQGTSNAFFFRLYQWRLNLKTKTLSGEYLTGTEDSLEFPMINNQYTGLQHSYAYAQVVDSLTGSSGNCDEVNPKYGGFAKFCLDKRNNTEMPGSSLIKVQYHSLGKDQFCSGAAFVPRVGGSHEDDGWIISFIHNERTDTSQASS